MQQRRHVRASHRLFDGLWHAFTRFAPLPTLRNAPDAVN
jgi:hypothetical protein